MYTAYRVIYVSDVMLVDDNKVTMNLMITPVLRPSEHYTTVTVMSVDKYEHMLTERRIFLKDSETALKKLS